jgi:hypothetical protein
MLQYIRLHCTVMAHSQDLVCCPSMYFGHRNLQLLSLICLLHLLWFQTAMKTILLFALTWNWNRCSWQLFPAELQIAEVFVLCAQCCDLNLGTDALAVLGFDMRFLSARTQYIPHPWASEIDNASSISCLK